MPSKKKKKKSNKKMNPMNKFKYIAPKATESCKKEVNYY